ncbi:T-complex protein 1 subunit gamma [Artemisia annua]|uniref:T-complex protein 1 subunit gamma n=1 Tax=Artemisia annua TaxID=35608 RepID=A0A2U1PBW8_ARTAN|nr:T-complex protein 1 subunit gamma [Artemisia annua]
MVYGWSLVNAYELKQQLMIELSRTPDEEVGDGTTSVIVLAGEMLHYAEAFIGKKYHPTVICRAYVKALEDALAVLDNISMSIDVTDREFYNVESGEELYWYKIYQSLW